MDLLKSKDGPIVFYHGAVDFLDPLVLRYWTPMKAPTIAHIPLSVQIFFTTETHSMEIYNHASTPVHDSWYSPHTQRLFDRAWFFV